MVSFAHVLVVMLEMEHIVKVSNLEVHERIIVYGALLTHFCVHRY